MKVNNTIIGTGCILVYHRWFKFMRFNVTIHTFVVCNLCVNSVDLADVVADEHDGLYRWFSTVELQALLGRVRQASLAITLLDEQRLRQRQLNERRNAVELLSFPAPSSATDFII